jgi:hypothetical protein
VYNLNYTPRILGGYKVEKKLHVGVREQQRKRLSTAGVDLNLSCFIDLCICIVHGTHCQLTVRSAPKYEYVSAGLVLSQAVFIC